MDASHTCLQWSPSLGDTAEPSPIDAQVRQRHKTVNPADEANYQAHVSVRSVPENMRRKTATVLTDEAVQMPWELSSDESALTIGSEETPAHLNYLAAGLGLFLLSHAEHLAKHSELEVDDAYLEKRLSWTATRTDQKPLEPALPYSRADIVELVLVIKSRSSKKSNRDLQQFCRQVQRAIRAITGADRISVTIYLDGEVAGQIGELSGNGHTAQS